MKKALLKARPHTLLEMDTTKNITSSKSQLTLAMYGSWRFLMISTSNVVVFPGSETVQANPWQQFAEQGDRTVKSSLSLTPRYFHRLDGIDGLVIV